MAEYFGLALDIGAYFVFSELERRLKDNLYEIRDNVSIFESHETLKRKLKQSETGEIPYARLEGRVEPTEQPLHTERDGETAVFRITDSFRVRRERNPAEPRRWTSTVEHKIGTELEQVPFCVALRKDAGVYANAEKIHNLKQFGKTVRFLDFDQIANSIRREAKLLAKKFHPDDECLTSYEISKLVSRSGVQREEYMMKSGSPVSVVGRIGWSDETQKQIVVSAPHDSKRLILTGDVDSVLLNMEDEAHRYNVARRTAIITGVVLFYLAWDRFYREFTAWRKRVKRQQPGG